MSQEKDDTPLNLGGRLGGLEAKLAELKRQREQAFSERALELETLVRNVDAAPMLLAEIRRVAHKIRGVAEGRPHLHALATQVEHGVLDKDRLERDACEALIQRLREIAKDASEAQPQQQRTHTSKTRPAAAKTAKPMPRPSRRNRKMVPFTRPRRFEKERVVIVDDDLDILKIVSTTLSALGGYEVVTAGTAQEAIPALTRPGAALVILDAMIPEADARSLAKTAVDAGNRTIVVYSAATSEELGWDLNALGILSWWRKPLSAAEMILKVRQIIKASKTAEE